jgi:hypothetical protein
LAYGIPKAAAHGYGVSLCIAGESTTRCAPGSQKLLLTCVIIALASIILTGSVHSGFADT